MAPLSRELTGVIFDHQHYGTHLNSKKETVDIELEKRNFAYAGKALASLFDSMPSRGRAIGGYDVHAHWVDPMTTDERPDIPAVSEEWKVNHMLRSRYFVMMRKCSDPTCCTPYRSPFKKVLPSGFLPSPRVYSHNTDGDLVLCKPGDVGKAVKYASLSNILAQFIDQDLPIDTYNQKVILKDVVCPFCNLSLRSLAEYGRHRETMHFRQRAPEGFNLEFNEIDNRDYVKEIIDEQKLK